MGSDFEGAPEQKDEHGRTRTKGEPMNGYRQAVREVSRWR